MIRILCYRNNGNNINSISNTTIFETQNSELSEDEYYDWRMYKLTLK